MKPDELNRRTWERRDVVREYAGRDAVWTVEKTIFERYRADLLDRRILDIGCGAGRTTPALLAYSRQYLGLDYSPAMVERFQSKFPAVPVVVGDMRRMTGLADGAFDVALCSFNTLDYVGHEDRLAALREIRRVLAPGGLFVFSSHNLNFSGARAEPRPAWTGHPLKLARNLAVWLVESWNHARYRSAQTFGEGYAVLNDCGHGFRLLSYYIERRRQAAQLAETGFALLETYDKQGARLGPQDDDRRSSFLYYVARKL